MWRREQDKFERTIALSLADTGRGGVGAGAGVAANDVEAQIIQQVMEMSRREQDEFERAIALSLADTGRGGVGQTYLQEQREVSNFLPVGPISVRACDAEGA